MVTSRSPRPASRGSVSTPVSGGGGGGFAAHQIDARALGAAAAKEVAVDWCAAITALVQGLCPMPMQGPHGAFRRCARRPRSCHASAPLCAEHVEHLPAARRDDQRHVGIHGLALEDGGHAHHVQIAGVGARADAHLIHLNGPGSRPRSLRCPGICGQATIGSSAERSISTASSYAASGSAARGTIIRLAALRLQEAARHLVGGEHRGRRAQLRAHVGDGRALRDGQRLNALAACIP